MGPISSHPVSSARVRNGGWASSCPWRFVPLPFWAERLGDSLHALFGPQGLQVSALVGLAYRVLFTPGAAVGKRCALELFKVKGLQPKVTNHHHPASALVFVGVYDIPYHVTVLEIGAEFRWSG